ncbi:MAG: hypothetical protein PHS92_02895 [Candidatus Gracilibacteria bacterium]|nr:hypothetical protein [Candidatus Gracilibacteria bacterium]
MDAPINDNFKFRQYLEASTLTFAEKYDIGTIFNCLSNERKIRIIDNWPLYLDQILKIRNETKEKRRENIMNTLNNINNIVNDAILRQRDQQEKNRRLEAEQQEINRNAQVFDQMRKTNDLQNLIKKQYE